MLLFTVHFGMQSVYWKSKGFLRYSLTGCCDEMMKSEQEVVAWILQPFSSWFLWFLPTQIQLPPGLAAARPGDWLLPLFFSPAALPHPAPPGHHPGQPGQLQRWVRVRVSLSIRQAKDERSDVYSPVFVLRAVFCVSGQFGAISVSRWSPEHSLARRDWDHPGKLTRTKPVTVSTQSTGFFIGSWLCFPVWPGSSRGSCQAARRRLPASPGSHFWCKDNSEQLRSQHTYTHTPKDSVSLIVSSLSSRWQQMCWHRSVNKWVFLILKRLRNSLFSPAEIEVTDLYICFFKKDQLGTFYALLLLIVTLHY